MKTMWMLHADFSLKEKQSLSRISQYDTNNRVIKSSVWFQNAHSASHPVFFTCFPPSHVSLCLHLSLTQPRTQAHTHPASAQRLRRQQAGLILPLITQLSLLRWLRVHPVSGWHKFKSSGPDEAIHTWERAWKPSQEGSEHSLPTGSPRVAPRSVFCPCLPLLTCPQRAG